MRAADLLALRFQPSISEHSWSELESARANDDDERVRSAALTVLVHRGSQQLADAARTASAEDPSPAVRRRVCELVGELPSGALVATMRALLGDAEFPVAEAAAAALGECPIPPSERTASIDALSGAATGHEDALVREAAVAALGSLGDRRGLPAILAGCEDKPAIRRRAVLALAPFTGDDVEAAIDRALEDRDWQTRQAAELLRESWTTNESS